MNRIIAKVEKGLLKGRALEIQLGEHSKTTKVICGGEDITHSVTAVYIKCIAGEMTKVTLEMIQREK